jgi:hypothetical protein
MPDVSLIDKPPQQTRFPNEKEGGAVRLEKFTTLYNHEGYLVGPQDRAGFDKLYQNKDRSQTKWDNDCNWKIHLRYLGPNHVIYDNTEEAFEDIDNNSYSGDPLYDFLFEKGYNWKPTTFTIYVGSKDEAKELADELIEKFGEYLKPTNYEQHPLELIKTNDPYAYGDAPFDTEGKIKGRFSGGVTRYNEMARGFLGLPFLRSFSDELKEIVNQKSTRWSLNSDIVENYGSEQNAILELTKVMDRMYDSLEAEFGEFFTGTDENREIGYHPGSLDKFLTIN